MHPDLVWKTTGVFPGLSKTYSGHDGFRRFWAEFTEPWETLEIGIEELYELDEETVLVRLRFYARGRQGIEVELPITNHLTIRDGKLVLFQGWPEWDQALSALGIEDPRGGGRS